MYSPAVMLTWASPLNLSSFSEHHAAGRHVDAKSQGFGGEDRLDQAVGEELLHDFLERGQHAGVVRGEAPQQAVPPAPEAEHVQIVGRDVLRGFVDPPRR